MTYQDRPPRALDAVSNPKEEEVMQDRSRFARLAVTALVAAAVAAPATATAMPVPDDGLRSTPYVPGSAAMYASSVHRQPAVHQELRTEGSIPASRAAFQARKAKLDLRTEAAADPSRAPEPPVGLPTWPLDPKPIVPAAPQPVATDGDGIDIEWPIAALALAGALALGGGLAFAGTRLRTAP